MGTRSNPFIEKVEIRKRIHLFPGNILMMPGWAMTGSDRMAHSAKKRRDEPAPARCRLGIILHFCDWAVTDRGKPKAPLLHRFH